MASCQDDVLPPPSTRAKRSIIVNDLPLSKRPKLGDDEGETVDIVKECYFDELLGESKVKELNDCYNASEERRYNYAKAAASSVWNEYIRISALWRKIVANHTSHGDDDADMKSAMQSCDEIIILAGFSENHTVLQRIDRLYEKTVQILSEFFDVSHRSLEVGPMGPCTLSLATFDTLWYFCRRDFYKPQTWVGSEFLDHVTTNFLKVGLCPDIFCKGLFTFLREYLDWKMSSKCREWIEKIESKIDRLQREWIITSHDSPLATTDTIRSANHFMLLDLTYDIIGVSLPGFASAEASVNVAQWIRMREHPEEPSDILLVVAPQ